MSKQFKSLEELQSWLNSAERDKYQIEYIVKDRHIYIVMLHPLKRVA